MASIVSSASPIAAINSGSPRRAAWTAAAGSIAWRTSIRSSRNSGGTRSAGNQAMTSGSSRFQFARGRTEVPARRRDATRPLAREHLERLAHRLPADAEALGKLRLTRQERPFGDCAGDDHPPDLMGDLPMDAGGRIKSDPSHGYSLGSTIQAGVSRIFLNLSATGLSVQQQAIGTQPILRRRRHRPACRLKVIDYTQPNSDGPRRPAIFTRRVAAPTDARPPPPSRAPAGRSRRWRRSSGPTRRSRDRRRRAPPPPA